MAPHRTVPPLRTIVLTFVRIRMTHYLRNHTAVCTECDPRRWTALPYGDKKRQKKRFSTKYRRGSFSSFSSDEEGKIFQRAKCSLVKLKRRLWRSIVVPLNGSSGSSTSQQTSVFHQLFDHYRYYNRHQQLGASDDSDGSINSEANSGNDLGSCYTGFLLCEELLLLKRDLEDNLPPGIREELLALLLEDDDNNNPRKEAVRRRNSIVNEDPASEDDDDNSDDGSEAVSYTAFCLLFGKQVKNLCIRYPSVGSTSLAPIAQCIGLHGDGLEILNLQDGGQGEDRMMANPRASSRGKKNGFIASGRDVWTEVIEMALQCPHNSPVPATISCSPRHLRTLVLSVPCRLDEVLATVGRCCPLLTHLNIAGCLQYAANYALLRMAFAALCFDAAAEYRSSHTTLTTAAAFMDDDHWPRIRNPCCDTLEILTISDPDHERFQFNPVPSSVAAGLLRTLTNLRALPHYPYTGEAIEELLATRKDNEKTELHSLHLDSLCDTWTRTDRLKAIGTLCAEATEIRLQNPQEGVLMQLATILPKVEKVRLIEVAHTEELPTLLRESGMRNLASFEVGANFESRFSIVVIDLPFVAKSCRYLKRLICCNVRISCEDEVFFEHLEELSLQWTVHIHRDTVKRLLPNCPRLVRLGLYGPAINLRDEDITTVLSPASRNYATTVASSPTSPSEDQKNDAVADEQPQPKLAHLQALWLDEGSHLTLQSLKLLVDMCPKLKWIGELSRWDIRRSELKLFRREIGLANVDVHLSWDDKTKGRDLFYYSAAGPIPIPRPLVVGDQVLP